jgi:hypothetical protein
MCPIIVKSGECSSWIARSGWRTSVVEPRSRTLFSMIVIAIRVAHILLRWVMRIISRLIKVVLAAIGTLHWRGFTFPG